MREMQKSLLVRRLSDRNEVSVVRLNRAFQLSIQFAQFSIGVSIRLLGAHFSAPRRRLHSEIQVGPANVLRESGQRSFHDGVQQHART